MPSHKFSAGRDLPAPFVSVTEKFLLLIIHDLSELFF